jgi:hypothetical protein
MPKELSSVEVVSVKEETEAPPRLNAFYVNAPLAVAIVAMPHSESPQRRMPIVAWAAGRSVGVASGTQRARPS